MRGQLINDALLEYRQHVGPSMASIDWHSLTGVRRELRIAQRLHDHHPQLFAPWPMVRRLVRLPGRLKRREIQPRFAALLVGLYSVMIVRRAWLTLTRFSQPHAQVPRRA